MAESEPTRRFWRVLVHHGATWWCVYLMIALFGTWPLCLSLTTTISIGFENEATVPLLNVWTLWWNSDRLAAGLSGYWNAPIFYPTRGTFAFSESQPTMMVLAPVVWLTGSRILAYNLYQLLILTLNGWSSQRLFLRLGHGRSIAFLGGVMSQMLPFVWWQMGVVQLTTLFAVVWTIHAVLDVLEIQSPHATTAESNEVPAWTVRIVNGLKLGAAYCLTYLLCNYWGLFLTMILVPSSVVLWNWSLLRGRFWEQIAIAASLSALVLAPLVYVQKSLANEHKWSRDITWIRQLSAHPRDYLDTPMTMEARTLPLPAVAPTSNQAPADPNYFEWSVVPELDAPEEGRGNVWQLGGGSLKLVVAPLGLIVALCTRGRRRWGLFAALFGLVAFGLSLGPTMWFLPWVPVVGDQSPYELLQKYVPGFALIRSPFRFAIFVQLAVVWLTVEAIDVLNPKRWRRVTQVDSKPAAIEVDPSLGPGDAGWVHPALREPRPSILPKVAHWTIYAAMLAVGVFLSLEVWPQRQSLFVCPSTLSTPAWIQWLRENSNPQDAVVCLPFPTGQDVGHYQETTIWMYWGTMHHRPLVNGYSGFFPQHFVDLKDQLNADINYAIPPKITLYPANSNSLERVSQCGARFVVISRSFATQDDVWRHPQTRYRWEWATGDEQHQLDVYEIQPEQSE